MAMFIPRFFADVEYRIFGTKLLGRANYFLPLYESLHLEILM